MSETSRSDESVPSLSSYPPAFVSLITTFIKRAEEAETRAHKALIILKTKDNQVLQLQQRMEVLEKIACRLEEVMVPPLDLPKSPSFVEELSAPHPREVNNKRSSHPPLETLYERFPTVSQKKESPFIQDGHNCYEKCQYLIDGLERSNCQLRDALTAESQQRMAEHEQYVASLAQVTQAVKDLQKKLNTTEKQNLHAQYTVTQPCIDDNFIVADEMQTISRAAGDADTKNHSNFDKGYCSMNSNQMAVFDMEDFKKNVGLAETIISALQFRLERRLNRKFKSSKNIKSKKSKRSVCQIPSKESISSYQTQKSSFSLKLRRVHISSRCFISALKKQNKKLKTKYKHVCEKFTESLTLCEKLQKELFCLSSQLKVSVKSNVAQLTQSTQTEGFLNVSLFSNRQEKLQSCKSTNLLQGRLEAAAKVMAKQCKQIQELQKQLEENLSLVEPLKKRLARAESNAASKELLVETTKKQLQETEKKNLSLSQDVQQMKDTCSCLQQELGLKKDECSKISKEKEICESLFEEMKMSLEKKLLSLSTALQQKEDFNDQMTKEIQNKLTSLREQFITQVKEASDRLVAADFKIQELYLGIETFLKLLFTLNSPELSPSSQAQAVQVASNILQLPPGEVQTILHSSRYDPRASRWVRECNRMVHEKVFAKNLGNLLIDAVLESRLT